MRALLPYLLLAVLVFASQCTGYGRDMDDDRHEENDPCDMEKEEGDCREYHKRFFFAKGMKFCLSFTHRGCKKNANNFRSRIDCYKTCDKKTTRESDDDTMIHIFSIKMNNPFSFYLTNKDEYNRKFKEAVAAKLPISTTEVSILDAKAGSTILYIEIKRSFRDDSFEKLLKLVQAGSFSINVAGADIKSVPNQDPDPKTYDGPGRHKRRCRKIALIIGLSLLVIGIIVAVVVTVVVMKKKKLRTSPMNAAKNAFQAVWKSDSPESVTTEKKQPPPEYDPTSFMSDPFAAPAYDALSPPAYESPAPPYAPQPPVDSYPTKNPGEVPA